MIGFPHRTALALAALTLFAPLADAHTSHSLARQAHGNPFRCDFDHDKRWGPKQKRCIVRVVFRDRPWLGREAAAIISCESGWDHRQVSPPFGASGLAQFLPSTWRRLPRRISRHSVFHPVWNVIGMRYLRMVDGSWRQWVCKPY